MQKMNWKGQAFLEKFCVKESSNLIDLENFTPPYFYLKWDIKV